jgi:hypothetical protein
MLSPTILAALGGCFSHHRQVSAPRPTLLCTDYLSYTNDGSAFVISGDGSYPDYVLPDYGRDTDSYSIYGPADA